MAFYEIERTDKHIVWRCWSCKALAVTGNPGSVTTKCGKCRT